MAKKVTQPKVNPVAGHLNALAVGVKEFVKPTRFTIQYPRERRWVIDRFRGFIINDVEKCISCFQCAWACPVNAIFMYRAPNGKFYPGIRYEQCILCHFCVDACPVGSLQGTTISDGVFPDLESTVFKPEDMHNLPQWDDEAEYVVKYDFDENGNLKIIKMRKDEVK
ncbi:NADH-quinone oxidoreductase subunit I [Caldivirga sp. UBA161]|uniref:NADH-quinone oxidoreductase subunit I n=1 Tax=Caldivirga sp. UBA161 TaxID=1915569 RepID=UPI0025C562E7|nr:NADH-quinone oxidoreductase subunit I [Caldivirga sp. UBA161]